VRAAGLRGSHASLWTLPATLRTISSNVGSLFGVDDKGLGAIRVGGMANFALFDSDPLAFSSTPALVVVGSNLAIGPGQP